ncbi:hypothetical protein D7D52_37430 [Nocardia yunnanensis]|uniref:Uncharacterized protein n=1 Tax=Nocardia yunnanensis TaxID=2382165 RepID=A0A386ZL33_9NOCA|nr:hypothetical protein D7D52_37430 [Nocardia yunnanensis]
MPRDLAGEVGVDGPEPGQQRRVVLQPRQRFGRDTDLHEGFARHRDRFAGDGAWAVVAPALAHQPSCSVGERDEGVGAALVGGAGVFAAYLAQRHLPQPFEYCLAAGGGQYRVHDSGAVVGGGDGHIPVGFGVLAALGLPCRVDFLDPAVGGAAHARGFDLLRVRGDFGFEGVQYSVGGVGEYFADRADACEVDAAVGEGVAGGGVAVLQPESQLDQLISAAL